MCRRTNLQSSIPLVRFTRYSGISSTYQELLNYTPNPTETAYVEELRINLTSTSIGYAQLRMKINKMSEIKNVLFVQTENPFVFNGNLIIKGDVNDNIKIDVKSDGSNTITVSCSLTGILEEAK